MLAIEPSMPLLKKSPPNEEVGYTDKYPSTKVRRHAPGRTALAACRRGLHRGSRHLRPPGPARHDQGICQKPSGSSAEWYLDQIVLIKCAARSVVVRDDNCLLQVTPHPAFRGLTSVGTRNDATEQDSLSTFIE